MLARDARGEELLAARIEFALECDDEGEGVGGEDAIVAVGGGGVDGGAGWESHGAFLAMRCLGETKVDAAGGGEVDVGDGAW